MSLVRVQSKTLLMSNFKLFFKYVFFKMTYSFVNNLAQRSKNTNVCINNSSLFFVCTHLKLSSVFYSTQLCDIFAYEVLNSSSKSSDSSLNTFFKYNQLNKANSTVIVYNFHSLHSQNRFFLFVNNSAMTSKSKFFSKNDGVESVAELFPAAN